jgi:hypothetical protein
VVDIIIIVVVGVDVVVAAVVVIPVNADDAFRSTAALTSSSTAAPLISKTA